MHFSSIVVTIMAAMYAGTAAAHPVADPAPISKRYKDCFLVCLERAWCLDGYVSSFD